MKKLIDPINTSDGIFHPKNKETGEKATIVTADYMNNTQSATRINQQELISILTAAEIAPDEATSNQVLTALKKLFLAIDDEHVSNALQKGNNLSDVEDAATSRKNLELDNVGNYAALPLDGGDLTGVVTTTAEIQSTSASSFRISRGDYGTFWFHDGTQCFLMVTNEGDPYGGYSDARPLQVTLTTGVVSINGYPPYSQGNCPFPVGYVMLMGNGSDPNGLYPGTTWQYLNGTGYDGKVIALGQDPLATGGSNTVTLAEEHMPPHRHNGGSTGDKGIQPDEGAGQWGTGQFGTDNKGNYALMQTSAAGGGQAFSVQNEFVHVLGWMRTA